MKRTFGNFIYLLDYAWRKCRPLFLTTAGKAALIALLPLINIAGLGIVVDALTNNRPKAEILKLIFIYAGVSLAVTVVSELLRLADNNIKRRASDVTQRDYMRDCVYINYHYVQDGSILDLKRKSMSAHPVWFMDDMGVLFKYVVQFIGVTYIFALLSPYFLLILLFTSALSVMLTFKEEHMDFKYRNECSEDERMMEYLYRTMTDDRYGKEVRINRADGLLKTKYSERLKCLTKRKRVMTNRKTLLHSLNTVIAVAQSAAMYLYFSYQVFLGSIGIGEYTVLLGAAALLISILIGFFKSVAHIQKTLSYTELFRKYQAHVAENSSITASHTLPMPDINKNDLTISFENVSFTYPGTGHPVLKNISFTVSRGEKIGIVGLNGSGKTTLIKLLCRLYDPTGGRITLNGTDIREFPHNEYTKFIGIVLQDFCLFAYTVRENIVFDKEFDEKRLYDSIEKSGLTNKIETLPKGIHTSVYKTLDDNGVEFSGGEGQKLSLARAIYKEAGILILDEPTSALDPIAEEKLFRDLADISGGKTTLFISHRLSSTRFCDRILVLSDGRIAESGTHDELMNKNGIYRELFSAQAKYYEVTEK